MIRKYEEVLKEECVICANIISIFMYGSLNVEVYNYDTINSSKQIQKLGNKLLDIKDDEEIIFECTVNDNTILSLSKHLDENGIPKYTFTLGSFKDYINNSNPRIKYIIEEKEDGGIASLIKRFVQLEGIDYSYFKEHLISLYYYFKITFNDIKEYKEHKD